MKICEEWKQAWKWLSVQLGAVITIAPELYEQMRDVMQPYMDDKMFHHVMAGLGVLMILNTIKKKPAK